jgi:hypothetical protein
VSANPWKDGDDVDDDDGYDHQNSKRLPYSALFPAQQCLSIGWLGSAQGTESHHWIYKLEYAPLTSTTEVTDTKISSTNHDNGNGNGQWRYGWVLTLLTSVVLSTNVLLPIANSSTVAFIEPPCMYVCISVCTHSSLWLID